MPLYVPKFHSGWEPPLDVLQEAPWEVEGLASAPDDEVRAPLAPPQTAGHLPPPPLLTSSAHLCPLPSPHTKPRCSFSPQPTLVNRPSFRNSPKHSLVSEPTAPPPGDPLPPVSSPHAHR